MEEIGSQGQRRGQRAVCAAGGRVGGVDGSGGVRGGAEWRRGVVEVWWGVTSLEGGDWGLLTRGVDGGRRRTVRGMFGRMLRGLGGCA